MICTRVISRPEPVNREVWSMPVEVYRISRQVDQVALSPLSQRFRANGKATFFWIEVDRADHLGVLQYH
jgi:hypothetical protein